MKKIILASQSPRRKELLGLIDVEFEVIPSESEENIEKCEPSEYVVKLSALKANDVASKISEDCFVVGADTIVVLEGDILGKPKDKGDAFSMLRRLSGNTHTVYTGVTVIDIKSGESRSFYEKTDVDMFDVSDEELKAYIDTGDPFDKAGGYGVQSKGAFLVSGIRGDFYNVVGLPVARLYAELKNF